MNMSTFNDMEGPSIPAGEPLPIAPLVRLADEYISGAHRDSFTAKHPEILRGFVKWALSQQTESGPTNKNPRNETGAIPSAIPSGEPLPTTILVTRDFLESAHEYGKRLVEFAERYGVRGALSQERGHEPPTEPSPTPAGRQFFPTDPSYPCPTCGHTPVGGPSSLRERIEGPTGSFTMPTSEQTPCPKCGAVPPEFDFQTLRCATCGYDDLKRGFAVTGG